MLRTEEKKEGEKREKKKKIWGGEKSTENITYLTNSAAGEIWPKSREYVHSRSLIHEHEATL